MCKFCGARCHIHSFLIFMFVFPGFSCCIQVQSSLATLLPTTALLFISDTTVPSTVSFPRKNNGNEKISIEIEILKNGPA